MKVLKVFALCLVVAIPALAENQPKDWQTGKLVSYDASSEQFVTTNNLTGNVSTRREVTRHIAVATPDVIYFADFQVGIFKGRPELVENNAIKYRVEKHSLWFLDENGKEYKCRIFKERKPE